MNLYSKKKSTSSRRLHCLLLKTQLFLLCIYIKRVTAANLITTSEITTTTSINPSITREGANVDTYLEFDNKMADIRETHYELNCPIESLVIRQPYMKLDRTTYNKYPEGLKKTIIDRAQVVWLKNGEILTRENGNFVQFGKDSTKSLIFYSIGLSDSGRYTCRVNYTQIPKEAYRYYKLYAGAKFDLFIDDKVHVPDIKATIHYHPVNQIVKRYQNTSFDCKGLEVLLQYSTYWIRCLYKDKKCMSTFINDYNNANKNKDLTSMHKYVIPEYSAEVLPVNNVTEDNIGYYGCWVQNDKGFDLRKATLELMEDSQYTTIAPLNVETTTELQVNNINNNIIVTNTQSDKYNKSYVRTILPVTQQIQNDQIGTKFLIAALTLTTIIIILGMYLISRCPGYKGQKKFENFMSAPIVSNNIKDENIRQHLPKGDCLDIYNVGKSPPENLINGFITGKLSHSNGHLMTQSICNQVLDDKVRTASIRSNNSNSDEASSWGKKSTLSSNHGDTSRAFYLHTSATTTTTVPLYDHPPISTLGGRPTQQHHLCEAIVQDACVINPTYGFIRLNGDKNINGITDVNDWYFPRRNLERLNKIGEGQFGEVWRYIARQRDGLESFVAVKQLKNRVGLGDRERLELIAEIEIMKSVNDHPNVIKLLNYCVDDFEPILLIMEYAENGKLQTYLRNCRSVRKPSIHYGCINGDGSIYADVHSSSGCSSANSSNSGTIMQPNITSKELLKFSYHIAKGMEYVASKGIIHRDLASRNILVSRDKICKVADFGFARRVSDDCAYERTTANPVPVKWMAPEALVENKFTSKSDVFSLGILMWEIVTLGATPYEYLNSAEVYKKVTSGGRLEKPAHCKEEFYSIMSQCWLHNPAERPTFKELALQLEKLLLSENDYIELDQYPEHAYYNILNTAEKEIVQNIIQ